MNDQRSLCCSAFEETARMSLQHQLAEALYFCFPTTRALATIIAAYAGGEIDLTEGGDFQTVCDFCQTALLSDSIDSLREKLKRLKQVTEKLSAQNLHNDDFDLVAFDGAAGQALALCVALESSLKSLQEPASELGTIGARPKSKATVSTLRQQIVAERDRWRNDTVDDLLRCPLMIAAVEFGHCEWEQDGDCNPESSTWNWEDSGYFHTFCRRPVQNSADEVNVASRCFNWAAGRLTLYSRGHEDLAIVEDFVQVARAAFNVVKKRLQ
jgi:hypothetical protein